MLARKCDFCGDFYEYYEGYSDNAEKANTIKFIDRSKDNYCVEREIYDLCPRCLNEVLGLVEKLKNSQAEEPFPTIRVRWKNEQEPLPTIEEMREYIKDYCDNRSCKECLIHKRSKHRTHPCFDERFTSDEEVIMNYKAFKKVRF